MATLAEIYDWFMTGKKPTQAQFWAAWGSFWNKNESIPQSAITNLSTVLNAKTENDQFNAHKVAADAHAALFDAKEDKTQKGVANGYAPLDEFVKLAAEYLNIVDDLVTGGATALASAETVKTLKGQIDAINILLASDNVNLDNVQEIVDAIETVQTSLSTILVNDLTTGGTTKALTAEMGKSLKALIDALYSNATIDTLLASKSDKILSLKTITGTAYSVIADDSLVELVYEGTAAMTVTIPNNSTVDLPIGTVFYTVATNTGILTIAGAAGVTFQTAVGMSGTQNEVRKYTKRGTNIWGIEGNVTSSADMILASTQTVSGLKTFLNGMFGLRNAANTFTSFFTTAATASRTYTLQNRNGVLADDTDLAGKMAVPSGTVNYLAKFLTATTIGLSRLWDTGTFFGIGTVNTPTKDITLGNQANRNIGIEESSSNNKGRDLTIEAGRTINYTNGTFLSNSLGFGIKSLASDPNGDIIAVTSGGAVYKKEALSENFVLEAYTVPTYPYGKGSFAITPNGDAFIIINTTIYKRTGRSGNYVSLGITAHYLATSRTSPDLYYCTNAVGVFKLINGTGSGVNQGATAYTYAGIALMDNNDVYVSVSGVTVGLKQTAGTGSYNNFTFPSSSTISIVSSANGNLYATTQSGVVYSYNGTSWVNIANLGASWDSVIISLPNTDIISSPGNSTYYYQQNYAVGFPDLDGGTLVHVAGTGKGTGKSRWQVWTGQKTTSGTDMQVLTKRLEVDEEGRITSTTMPTYADNTAALAGGLTAGMFYRTSTGILMIVY